jgi:predicted PurR-regulated permease PerM
VLAALLVAKAAILVRDVIILVVISAFLAIGLNPAVEWLQRHRVKRGIAVASVIGAVLLFFGGFVAAAAPPVARQASQLQKTIPEYAERLRENPTFRRLDNQYKVTDKVKEAVQKRSGAAAGAALSAATALLGIVFKTLTVLVLTLYFLSAYPGIKRGAYRMVPRSRRARVGLIADEILNRVGGYVLGNLATSVVAGVCSVIFFAVAGIPYPVALAMLVAIFDLIPLVGATIAAVVVSLLGFTDSVVVGIACVAFYIAYQQFENYVVYPRVMRKAVDVPAPVTVVAVLLGGALLGVVGALLAIPIAAAALLIIRQVAIPRMDRV